MKILYFGGARDVMGLDAEDVEVSDDISSFEMLIEWARNHHPAIGQMITSNRAKVAVDGRVIGDQDNFPQPQSIIIFPPLSGG